MSYSKCVCVLENKTFVQACDRWLLVMCVPAWVPATGTATRATTVPHGATAGGRVPSEATGSSAADVGATAAAAAVTADYSWTRSVLSEAGRLIWLRGFRAVTGQNGGLHWLQQSLLQQVSTTVLPVRLWYLNCCVECMLTTIHSRAFLSVFFQLLLFDRVVILDLGNYSIYVMVVNIVCTVAHYARFVAGH